MIQDQSLFTVGTGATLRSNMAVNNKFATPQVNQMAKPMGAALARNQAAQISMNANNMNVQFQKLGNAVNQSLDNAAYNLNSIMNGQA